MHGFGASGDDLVSLWRVLGVPAETRFVFPEAPIPLPGYPQGRAWWIPKDLARIEGAVARGETGQLWREVPEGLAEARDSVIAMLDDMDRMLRPSKVVIGGFSQGAMLACDVALRTARPLAGLVLLSGTFLAEDEWRSLMPSRRALPAFLSHGDADRMLPLSGSERLRDALKGAGLTVTWAPFRGGHEIPSSVLAALGVFLRDVL
jgi:phospholipase/carboxylesterase